MNIFVRAVEANSFVKAARSLLVDPAAVTRAIKALEVDLGVLLFARSTRALSLTAEGARFYRDCVQVLKRFGEATQQFRATSSTPQGRLKIGMTTGLTRRMLVRVIPRFQELYPQIEIVLLSISDMAEVGERGVDVVLRPHNLRQRGGHRQEAQGLVVRKIIQSKFMICASPEYLSCAGVPRVPADLRQHACVALLTLEYDVQDEWQFAKSGLRQRIKFAPRLLIHGTEGYRDAGVAGCGIIRILGCHIEDELASRKLVPVLTDWESVSSPPIVAIYRKTRRPLQPHVDSFLRYLEQTFRCSKIRSNQHNSRATP